MEKAIELIKSSGNEWVLDNIILFVKSGSRAYGLEDEDSDYDYKAICIPPIEYHLGLKNFKTMHLSTGSNDSKNASDDIDISIYSLSEFFKLAIKGNPNIIEMLFVEEEDILYASREGVELGLRRNDFLSTANVKRSFGGFAGSAKNYMDKPFGLSEDVARKKTKHSLRVYEMAIDALTTGEFKTRSSNPEYLKDVMNSKIPLDSLVGRLGAEEEAFKRAIEASVLEYELDEDTLSRLLMNLLMSYLNIVDIPK